MDKLVLASNNTNKIEEIKNILQALHVDDLEVLGLSQVGFYTEIEENGTTFNENALIKARAVLEFIRNKNIRAWVLADDSGLCVKALNNEPGVYSARYAGDHDNQANRNKILEKLKGELNREAYFMCAMALISPDGKEYIFNGHVNGRILEEEVGTGGFGYDCIFYSYDLGKGFGQCSQEEKNTVSHRGRALRQVLEFLKNQ